MKRTSNYIGTKTSQLLYLFYIIIDRFHKFRLLTEKKGEKGILYTGMYFICNKVNTKPSSTRPLSLCFFFVGPFPMIMLYFFINRVDSYRLLTNFQGVLEMLVLQSKNYMFLHYIINNIIALFSLQYYVLEKQHLYTIFVQYSHFINITFKV